jgi:GNAT superfamily N-acetyltransferase
VSGPTGGADDLEVRPYRTEDRAAVLDLLSASLGWVPDDVFDAYFAWKHEENPLGASAGWVALTGGRVVGLRTFLRWRFTDVDGRDTPAVRAVDTATHPDFQGRGVFRRLTLHALEELAREGVAFVFNTPNDQSRPGYLRMGWQVVGRLPTAVRPTSFAALGRMARARVPAERWSLPSDVGWPAVEAVTLPATAELLGTVAPPGGLRTHRSVEHLLWRYGFSPLRYRALALDDDPAQGLAVFRTRRRGASIETALCEVTVPDGDRRAARELERIVAHHSGGDHVIRLGGPAADRAGYVRLPRQGPLLVWRDVTGGGRTAPGVGRWDLTLGDIELF